MIVNLRAGDTLWYYSQLFNLPLELVLDSNPGLTPLHLIAGQPVQIPGYVTTAYRIMPGDTLWSIATSRNMTVEMIVLLNPGLQPSALVVGQTIQLPERVTRRIVNPTDSYDYARMTSELNQLAEIYPFLQNRSIGSTVMGKSIPEVRLGKGNKRVHMNGSFHANEWITIPVLMQFLNEYLLALTNRTPIRGVQMDVLYRTTMLSLVPMVNPDGVDLVIHGPPATEPFRSNVLEINGGNTNFSGWKANIRGVDLNDQFPALWEREAAQRTNRPAPRDYPGTAPLTEPEAIAMAQLTRESDFQRVLAFHTQGKVIYWGFMNLEPPESEVLVNEFSRVSGYVPIRTVDSYAGYKDWFIQDWRRPGYTVELGRGVNPLPFTQFPEIYQESLGIMLVALLR